MAISALTNFTVPLDTSQSASGQGLLMPKLKYRFRVSFLNFGVSSNKSELTKQVITFKRPSVKMSELVLDVYNSKVYLAGKPEWEPTACTIRDDAVGNVSRLVGEQMQKQFDFYEQSSAASAIDYKFQTVLELLDGGNGSYTPNVLETWEMDGCWLTSVEYGEADYKSNEPFELSLNIRFDNAIQTPLGTGIGTGIGTHVGRTLGTAAIG
jgi:hypothetical protein